MTVVGIIGLGFMGRTHLDAYRQVPGVTVGAIASRKGSDAEGVARELGATFYADAEDLLRDPRIEAVSITVPTHLHGELAVAAIEAGKHVLVEKPLGLTVEECLAIKATADDHGKVVMVGHVLRYWPAYVQVVELVQGGQLGRPLGAFAERLSSPPRWSGWLADPRLSGGAVHDFHIHDLDVLNWVLGTPEAVYSSGIRGESGGWDQMVSLVRYGGDDGRTVWGSASASTLLPDGYPFTTRLRIVCERGAVELSQVFDGEQVDSGVGSGPRIDVYEGEGRVTSPEVTEVRDPYLLEVTAFVDAVRTGAGPTLLDEGTMAVRTALAARRSLDSGLLAVV